MPDSGRQVHEAMCCKSASGYYLKYSELSGDTIEQLVAVILSNAAAAATTGVRHFPAQFPPF